MKSWYRLMCRVIAWTGLYHLVRLLIARNRTTIVLYHDPEPEIFEQHVSYLVKNYTIITLQELVEFLHNPLRKLPEYSLVITFDDGHKGNYLLMNSIRKHRLKPTIYACSGIVGTNRKYWFRFEDLDAQRLKKMDHELRLRRLSEVAGFSPEKIFRDEDRQAINTEELSEMKEFVDFQSHTRFHPILTTCTDELARDEIDESRQELSKLVLKPVLHFAYPNGDYSSREMRILKEAGYISARTTVVGWNSRWTNPYRLKITGVNDRASLGMLKAELTGIPGYLYNIYKSGITRQSLRGFHIPERDRQ